MPSSFVAVEKKHTVYTERKAVRDKIEDMLRSKICKAGPKAGAYQSQFPRHLWVDGKPHNQTDLLKLTGQQRMSEK